MANIVEDLKKVREQIEALDGKLTLLTLYLTATQFIEMSKHRYAFDGANVIFPSKADYDMAQSYVNTTTIDQTCAR